MKVFESIRNFVFKVFKINREEGIYMENEIDEEMEEYEPPYDILDFIVDSLYYGKDNHHHKKWALSEANKHRIANPEE
jgi:hypothetical protein